MRVFRYLIIFLISCSGTLSSCSSEGSDEPGDNQNNSTPPNNVDNGTGDTTSGSPSSFSLTFPNNNEVCQEGAAVANQQEKLIINFKWGSSTNANNYEILVVESESGSEIIKTTTEQTNYDVQVDKGVLYQWNVTAKNDEGEFVTASWSFYSRGETINNYVPYPAFNVEFTFNSASDFLNIQWEASDEDGDTLTFDVSIFEDGTEIFNDEGLTSNEVSDIPASFGSVYFAVIVVNDGISATTTTSEEVTYL